MTDTTTGIQGTTRIQGKVVAITGASSGIGEATALLLAERGASVVLGARRTDRLDDIVRRIRKDGGRATARAVDVTRREDLDGLVQQAVDEFGRLDVLISNAGIARLSPVADVDTDGWQAMIDVNLNGALNGLAAALPVFRRQGEGHLVTTVSTSGLQIVPTQAIYAATKNAVRTLLEGLRQESTDGVLRTTSVSPGYVRTELIDSMDMSPAQHGGVRHPPGRRGPDHRVRHRAAAGRRDRRGRRAARPAGLTDGPGSPCSCCQEPRDPGSSCMVIKCAKRPPDQAPPLVSSGEPRPDIGPSRTRARPRLRPGRR
jgi:NADP-dependent 3-hydroxy acid dehydrogenase YdfG